MSHSSLSSIVLASSDAVYGFGMEPKAFHMQVLHLFPCSPEAQSHYVAYTSAELTVEADLELSILLPQPPNCRNYRLVPHLLLRRCFHSLSFVPFYDLRPFPLAVFRASETPGMDCAMVPYSLCMCIDCRHQWSSGEEAGSLGAGLTGGCETSDVGVRNQTQVLHKRDTCSKPQAIPPTLYRLFVYYFLYTFLSNILFYIF